MRAGLLLSHPDLGRDATDITGDEDMIRDIAYIVAINYQSYQWIAGWDVTPDRNLFLVVSYKYC